VISDSNMFLFQFTFRDSGTLDDTKIITRSSTYVAMYS
jgi:hypothetical protein